MLNKNLWMVITVGLIMLMASSSCTFKADSAGEGAQGVLKAYIAQSFQVRGVAEREHVLSFLTGPTKTRLAAWSDDQFSQAFIDTKREFVKLVIVEEKKLSASEENITYELVYIDHGRSQSGHGAQVTNKKLSHLVQEKGKWLISEMHNIKELVEYRNEMTFPY